MLAPVTTTEDGISVGPGDEEWAEDVPLWALTPHERAVYEAGFQMGYAIRELEIQRLQDEVNRYYRAAFDHDHHDCRIHTPTRRHLQHQRPASASWRCRTCSVEGDPFVFEKAGHMAQKVITTLVDDIDGTEITDGEGETIRFAIDGTSYEIDLTTDNAEKLRDALQPYIDNGRRTRNTTPQPKATSTSSSNSREDLTAAREWLKNNGHQVSDRGRVPNKLLELYRAQSR